MTTRASLLPQLPTAFRVADGLAAGASRKRLLASDLDRPFHGIRSTVPDRRAALVAAMTVDHAFTGPTAAAIWHLPLPRRWQNDSQLHVVSAGRDRLRRAGVVSSRRAGLATMVRDGLPVLTPASTWLSLGVLLSAPDLTAAGDRLVSGTLKTPALCSVTDLVTAMDAAGRIPGIRTLRTAFGDIRVGAWSRPETFLRLLIAAAGIPEPVLNACVRLLDGDFAYPDLAWPHLLVALEYDGEWHENPIQRSLDLARHEKLVDAGWLVVHVRRGELFTSPSALVSRIVRRLRDRGFVLDHPIEWADMPRFVA